MRQSVSVKQACGFGVGCEVVRFPTVTESGRAFWSRIEVDQFNWLGNIPLLTSVIQIMAIEKSKVYPHFLDKGNELQKGSLKRGLKPTQVEERERAREFLKDLI